MDEIDDGLQLPREIAAEQFAAGDPLLLVEIGRPQADLTPIGAQRRRAGARCCSAETSFMKS